MKAEKLLAAIRTLTDVIGPKKLKPSELQQSEILQLLQTLPQAGGATPEGKAVSTSASNTRYGTNTRRYRCYATCLLLWRGYAWRSNSTINIKEELLWNLFKPRGASAPRRPTDNNQKNGQIINTPRFSQFGGLTASNKAGYKNMMSNITTR
jgi:hypothetical protein